MFVTYPNGNKMSSLYKVKRNKNKKIKQKEKKKQKQMANDQNDVALNKPDITLVPPLKKQTVNSVCENVFRNSSGVYT